ncbi:hypothetical protein [Thiomonas intermedia]|uniref:hypothetical protein n=1 Tax=Thiomonas intermedia TaxID=926 RepID=UPI0009A4FA3A|nr:hypothetical protein [Thiomonas intermedia]
MCLPAPEQSFELVRWVASIAIPAISALAGVVIGALLTSGRERKQHKLAFLEKQLSTFYSPMLGLRNEIKTHGAFRSRVQNEANAAWVQLCKESENLSIEARLRITNERGPEFTRIIEYDNNKLHEELLPAYRKMVELFRECYWLAEPETRAFYGDLLEFVEVWNRWIDKALPVEVLKRLEHGEDKLGPFYEHVEQTHNVIRQKLKDGAP